MDRLNRKRSAYQDRPVKVIQFGEGNFLRAFADYMIDCANEQNIFNGNIVLIKPMPQNTASDISNLFQKLFIFNRLRLAGCNQFIKQF